MYEEKTVYERAISLVNTSVEDMKSGLWFYRGNVPEHLEIIRRGREIVKRRGEVTKLRLLDAKIKKMLKEKEAEVESME